ncbi:MAG TPA: alpha/beta fold hydrolase [Candidatus Limnocylindria bacterium]|nr:alpha/beta fold hydrolase [Candidatus Limnocylindria bacterium]
MADGESRSSGHVVLASDDGRDRLAGNLGWLDVPVRHADPDGPTRQLAFVRLPATTDRPGPPIVVLAGGPGESGVASLVWSEPGRGAWWDELRRLGDVIALDQRGTGWSWPVPEALRGWNLPLDHAVEADEAFARAVSTCRAMRSYWAERDDVGAYTVVESADDVARLATAIGSERIRLVGASYGSHLGMAVIRRHPDRVDRAVLSLVEGPDQTYKLPSRVDAALRGLAGRAAVAGERGGGHPDLVGLLEALLSRLARSPARLRAGETTVVCGRFDLQRAVASRLGDQDMMARLPVDLRRLEVGDGSWLAEATVERRRGWPSSAVYYHTDAASGASPARREQIASEAADYPLGDVIDFPFPGIEAAWGDPDIGDALREPVTSDIPVQFLSGGLDGRTPPENVLDVRPGFSRSGHIVVDGIAHDEGLASAAVRARLSAFLGGGEPADATLQVPFRFGAQ